jgi:predicted RNA binding protein YcfA (HicA-like mRNA interferase family)
MVFKRENDPRSVSIPAHRELATGTTRAIIRQLGLTVDEFLALIR